MAKKLAFDKLLFSTVIVLTVFGLIMVYSASVVQDRGAGVNRFLVKQSLAAALGLAAMWVAMHVDLQRLRRPAVVYTVMLGVFALLLATLLGPEWNDVNRWLFIGAVSVQPSELAKLAVAIFVAYQIHRQTERDGDNALLLPCGMVLAAVVGLILLQPDLGTSALICGVALLMLFLSGVRKRFFASGAMALVPLLAAVILTVDYQRERLMAFLDPGLEPMGMNWQANQSLIAVGSGGLSGVGLAQGVQKLHFLPHPHSDFIYAVIAEELGFLGAVAVLAVFALLVWRGAVAGARANEVFGRYLAWGLTGLVALQAALHVGVVLKLLPTKGIPLPFISYGGSSLVVCLIAAGLILNVSQHG
ncbi:MAG: putative lipid II flippase FtsW [Thermoanaerobaculia bacterium]